MAGADGTQFTVKGVVTLIDGKNIYVQDATGAICVRMTETPSDIAVGETIIGTGSKSVYNGLVQLGDGTYEKSTGCTLSVKETTVDALTEADICTAIKIKGLTVKAVSGSNYTLVDAQNHEIVLYKPVLASGVTLAVGDVLDFQGALGYYNAYQLRNSIGEEINITNKAPQEPVNPPAGNGAYTKIDKVANLTAGKYLMAVYAEAYQSNDYSANPYHFWDGNIGTGSEKKDLITNTYAYTDGALTKYVNTAVSASKNGDAVQIELIAVEGKANTYYIKYGDKYLSATYAKRSLELSATPAEWVAEDNANGGIVLHHHFSSGYVTMGYANAASNMIRSYKDSNGAMNNGIKSGIIFFAENTAE